MNNPSATTVAERDALEEVIRAIREEWGFAASFDLSYLLDRWDRLVASVECGYELSLFDSHDLSLRDELERVTA